MRGRTQNRQALPFSSSRMRKIERKEEKARESRRKGAHCWNCNCRATLPMIEYPATRNHPFPTMDSLFFSLSFSTVDSAERAHLMPDTKLAESCNGGHARCENNAQIFDSERNYEARPPYVLTSDSPCRGHPSRLDHHSARV